MHLSIPSPLRTKYFELFNVLAQPKVKAQLNDFKCVPYSRHEFTAPATVPTAVISVNDEPQPVEFAWPKTGAC